MKQEFFFQLSLDDAKSFINDCVLLSVAQALQQGANLALASANLPKEEKLLNTKEVCKLLHITRATSIAWRKSGKLPFERMEGRIYFYEKDVLAALKSFNRRAKS